MRGSAEGIGSRFFTVQNGAGLVAAARADELRLAPGAVVFADGDGEEPSRDALVRVRARVGFDLTAPLVGLDPDEDGRRMMTLRELGRLELQLSGGPRWAEFMRVGTERTPLPIGSRLDPATGDFTWTPGVGFIGAYELEFVGGAGTADEVRVPVTVVIRPKHGGPSRVHLVINAPRSGAEVTQPFLLGGWALDEAAFAGTGVDAVHVWVYPDAGSGAEPRFVGVHTLDGERPDVARAFGAQFERAGWGLAVNGLAPGTYDVAVFPHGAVTGQFAPATVVRVTVW